MEISNVDVAYCRPLARSILASEFAKLPPVRLEQLRHQLNCIDCEQPAIFRRASSDGRAACFVGHPHAEGCPSATVGDGSRGTGGDTTEDERYNPDDHVIIDLRLDLWGDADAPGGRTGNGKRRGGRTFGGEGGTRRAKSYRRLRKLLRTLVHSPAFANTDKVIELQGVITAPASQFFLRLRDSKARDHALRGYWGRITSAVAQTETIWLNTDGPVIPVNKGDKELLLEISRVAKLAHLTDAHILVLGSRETSVNGRAYIACKDLTRIAIIPKKETIE